VDPILGADEAPLVYAPGSWGPADAHGMIADLGAWTRPRLPDEPGPTR
jgi:hypothetical protein